MYVTVGPRKLPDSCQIGDINWRPSLAVGCRTVGGVFNPSGRPKLTIQQIVGDVVAVHQSEKKWKIGDRVGSGWHGGHCFQCDSCRRGDFVTCQHQTINGEYYFHSLFLRTLTLTFIHLGISADGGYAEYVTIRTEAVVKVPESMDPAEAAPLLCAGVTTFS